MSNSINSIVAAMLFVGLGLPSCVGKTTESEEATPADDALPTQTRETVARGQLLTTVTIEKGHTVSIYEVDPGVVLVGEVGDLGQRPMSNVPIGSLIELYETLAPGASPPQAVIEANVRFMAAVSAHPAQPAKQVGSAENPTIPAKIEGGAAPSFYTSGEQATFKANICVANHTDFCFQGITAAESVTSPTNGVFSDYTSWASWGSEAAGLAQHTLAYYDNTHVFGIGDGWVSVYSAYLTRGQWATEHFLWAPPTWNAFQWDSRIASLAGEHATVSLAGKGINNCCVGK